MLFVFEILMPCSFWPVHFGLFGAMDSPCPPAAEPLERVAFLLGCRAGSALYTPGYRLASMFVLCLPVHGAVVLTPTWPTFPLFCGPGKEAWRTRLAGPIRRMDWSFRRRYASCGGIC